ncbi:MAG TPA: SLC13 family permease, partial [Anaerolineales bacterium]
MPDAFPSFAFPHSRTATGAERVLTPHIALTLGILLAAVVLLVTERLRVDLVALLVLVALAVSGLVTAEEALSGFSNPAVVTVWAVFILSAGLARTGVASRLGKSMLRLGKRGSSSLLLVIMLVSAGLSAFMNNVGVTAMLLPAIAHIARKTGISASKMLMPLAFGTMLGGMTTLIGTPPNILVSEAMADLGLPSFELFDFARVGIPIALAGILFMVLFGHRLLPDRQLSAEFHRPDSAEQFELRERFFTLRIPEGSLLDGRSLGESRLGSALKLTVIGVRRNGHTTLAPDAAHMLQGGDELLVLGRSDWLEELAVGQQITLESGNGDGDPQTRIAVEHLISKQISVVEAIVPEDSPLVDRSLAESRFRASCHANVLAIWKQGLPLRTNLQDIVLAAGDRLLVQAARKQLDELESSGMLTIADYDALDTYHLEERLLLIAIPEHSSLAGKTLAENKLADAFGLSVLGITRDGTLHLMPDPDEKLHVGDKLMVEGKEDDVQVLRALRELEAETSGAPGFSELESEEVGLVEVVVSPHANLNEKNLRELNFREKYGLSVLAIWRSGRAYRSNLRGMPLQPGDSLLIYGHRNRIRMLAKESDFIVLSPEVQPAPHSERARLASLIMSGVVLSVALGWLPIAVAAIAGAVLMVLSGCLDMEEAYRSIRWPVIFLIAGMLPLGIAMQSSGAARFLADQVIALLQPFGATALLAGLFLLTTIGAQIMPNSVIAVIMLPIAINTATSAELSRQA